jgi:two-component system, NtrC family, response regulator HydG
MNQLLNILVVDDDADNANSLAELFELEGHTVTMVHSGEDAIAAYLNQSYDLAFMDVMMPGKNGVESFLEIKKMKPNAKVIMMTGYSVEQLLQQAIENGALGVLTKPLEPRKVLALLRDVGPKGVVVAQSTGNTDASDMQNLLNSAGHNCQMVNSSSDYAGFVPSSDRDVIILNFHTPLIEGVGFYKELRKAGVCVPVIILTDSETCNKDPHEILRDFRATGILNKPFDPDHLLSQLRALAA